MTREDMLMLEEDTLLYFSKQKRLILFRLNDVESNGYVVGWTLYPFSYFELATEEQLNYYLEGIELDTKRIINRYFIAYHKSKQLFED